MPLKSKFGIKEPIEIETRMINTIEVFALFMVSSTYQNQKVNSSI